jgi:hypothetical protein
LNKLSIEYKPQFKQSVIVIYEEIIFEAFLSKRRIDLFDILLFFNVSFIIFDRIKETHCDFNVNFEIFGLKIDIIFKNINFNNKF